jgi:hypothetical protein
VNACLAVIALSVGVSSCAKEVRPEPLTYAETSVAVIVSTSAHAKASLGKSIRVEGTAHNAKLSAVVVGERVLIYCLDVPAWPKALAGKKVAVEGKLELSHDFEAQVGPDGARTAGTGGPIFVIRKSRTQPLP